jgi:hypothetical protein
MAISTKPMLPVPPKDIESELSYAYLHAVASQAKATCKIANRLEDNRGIDAQLTSWGPFNNGGDLVEVDVKVQLKATIAAPTEKSGFLSYVLSDIEKYNDLRRSQYAVPRILVVLFLPREPEKWLVSTDDELTLRNAAYWVSLAGADSSANSTSVTVYLPKSQRLTPEALVDVFSRLSRQEQLPYTKPGVSK